MYVCAHACVDVYTSPSLTLQLCSSYKRLGFREKLCEFLCLRAINDCNEGGGHSLGLGPFLCTLVLVKEQTFVSLGDVGVQTPLSALCL